MLQWTKEKSGTISHQLAQAYCILFARRPIAHYHDNTVLSSLANFVPVIVLVLWNFGLVAASRPTLLHTYKSLTVDPRSHAYCVLFLEAMRGRALWYVCEHIHMYFMVSMRVWPLHALAHILLFTYSV